MASGTGAPAARFTCCEHCEGRCAHLNNHPVPCSDGCNARAWKQHLAHADAMHAASAQYLPPHRPVNGRNLGTQPRRERPGKQPWLTAAFPVYNERPQLDVIAAERSEYVTPDGTEIIYHRADHDEIDRLWDDRPSLVTLRAVLRGLRKL